MRVAALLVLALVAAACGKSRDATCHPICPAGYRPAPGCDCAPIAAPSASSR